jgi:hypothetical protein
LLKHKIFIAINIISCLIILAIGYKELIRPKVTELIFANDYKQLMFKCDNVMRDHMIAKNRVLKEKTIESVKLLENANIGLITCNEYDLLRKKMLINGLSEDDLALLGLEAIEENNSELIRFAETHEFKY